MNWLMNLLLSFIDFFAVVKTPLPAPVGPLPTPEPPTPVTPHVEPPTKPQPYDWSTPEAARHSLRVICDEEGLSVYQKNLMSQVVHCESGYKTNLTNHNKDKSGKVWSIDYGICMWNDYFHGKEITPDEAINNPEKAVRLMCAYVKAGRISQWSCFSLGLYKNYTA